MKMSANGGGHVNTAKVLVVKGDHAALLGRKTAEQLRVLRVTVTMTRSPYVEVDVISPLQPLH